MVLLNALYRFLEFSEEHPAVTGIISIALAVIAIIVYYVQERKFDVALKNGDKKGVKNHIRYFKICGIVAVVIFVVIVVVGTALLNE